VLTRHDEAPRHCYYWVKELETTSLVTISY
jgi:hypothetical protein